jgi:hypothetical protein
MKLFLNKHNFHNYCAYIQKQTFSIKRRKKIEFTILSIIIKKQKQANNKKINNLMKQNKNFDKKKINKLSSIST